jgi:hypothetical protein
LSSELRRIADGQLLTFPFEWSGRNTNDARVTAGRELARCLHDRAQQYPSAKHAIIAHSHGGNIALYAASASGIPDLKVATLGTPFIQASPRHLQDIGIMLVTEIAVIVYLVSFWFGFSTLMDLDRADFFTFIFLLIGGPAAAGASVFFLSGWLIDKVLRDRINKRRDWLVRELTTAYAARNKILVVSVKGDEAMRALSVLDLIASLPYAIVSLLAGVFTFVVDAGKRLDRVNTWGRLLAQMHPVLVAPYLLFAFVLIAIPLACFFLSIPIFLLGAIRRVGYWDDKLSDYAIASIKVALRPQFVLKKWDPGSEEIRTDPQLSPIRTIVYSSTSAISSLVFQRLLQHSSLYQREDIAREICAWLVSDQWPRSASPLLPDMDK